MNSAQQAFQLRPNPYATLASVAAIHLALLAALLLAPDTHVPVIPPHPLTVSLIVPEVKNTKPRTEPKPTPATPHPAVKPRLPSPVLAREPTTTTPPMTAEAPKPVRLSEPVPEVLPPPAPPQSVAVVEAPQAAPPVSPPRPADYLNNPKPPYPALSKRLGEEGIVRLNILVNPDGSVAHLEVVKSSGYPRLDDTARKTVESSWKFEPARQAGKPVSAWVIVPIQFTLSRS